MASLSTIYKNSLLGAALFMAASPAPPEADKPAPARTLYKSLVAALPAHVGQISREKPTLKNEIKTSYVFLRHACPALSRVDIKSPWNLADWMNRKISQEEWNSSPYSFRMNSFRAVSIQRNTTTKTELLGKLYNAIPSHPMFVMWVDDGKKKLREAVQSDAILKDFEDHWEWTNARESRLKKYYTRIAELTFESFLPQQDVEHPKIEIRRDHVGYRGQHSGSQKIVRFNMSDEPAGIKTPEDARTVAIHEYFHAVEDIIKNWYLEGRFKENPVFADAGEKFFYGTNALLAYVTNGTDEKTDKIYANTFVERASYYVMNAGNLNNPMVAQSDAPDFLDRVPLHEDGRIKDQGMLPAACRLK